jgi:hypothetical protein
MTEKRKIDPRYGAATFLATKYAAVKLARLIEIGDV